MTIRELTPADAEAYWHLRLEALQNEPFAFGTAAEEHQATTVKQMADRLRHLPLDDDFTLGSFDADTLVGIATFVREPGLKERHKAHLLGLYIAASHQNRRIGRNLVQAVIDKARSISGLEQILLGVSVSQKAAAHLYTELGFERYGTEPRALKLGSAYMDEHNMLLRLH